MSTPTPPGDQNGGFGQQPQGQPYGGQPGQPQNPGQPAFPQAATGPVATQAPKKKGFGSRILSTLVSLVVVAAVAIGIGFWSVNSGPKVGSCVTASGTSTKAKTKKIDCSDTSTFSYEVTSKQSSNTCGADYVSLTMKSRGQSKVYCMMPNFAEGKCYDEVTSGNEGFKVVPCTGSYDMKVDKRIDGVGDKTKCDPKVSQGAWPYTKDPKRTYCLSQKK